MRNLNKSENIKSVATKESLSLHVTQLDVTDDASVKNAVDRQMYGQMEVE